MKIPYDFKCEKCHKNCRTFVDLNADRMSLVCECGQKHPCSQPDHYMGRKILLRADYELKETKDYPMSIVFSAMAFECDLADLHHRKHRLDTFNSTKACPDDEELDRELRKYPTIAQRIDRVAQKFNCENIDDFIRNSLTLTKIIEKGFPSIKLGSIAKDFQKNLFWPRNRVLHLGFTNYSEQDAQKCHNIAKLGCGFLQGLRDVWANESV